MKRLVATCLGLTGLWLANCPGAALAGATDRPAGPETMDAADLRSVVSWIHEVTTRESEDVILDRVADMIAEAADVSTLLNLDVQSNGHSTISASPGAQVRYEITGVLSDDANQGLGLIGLTLVFDGGDLTQADEPQGEPTPGCDNPMINFTKPWGITNPAGFGGTLIGGDLVQVGGGQNTINNTPDNADYPIGPVLLGVAQPSGCGPAVLVTGALTAPVEAGTYTLAAIDVFAIVILEDATGDPYWAVGAAGNGTNSALTITVSDAPTIPTTSTWGVAVLALLLLVGTTLRFRHMRRHAGRLQFGQSYPPSPNT